MIVVVLVAAVGGCECELSDDNALHEMEINNFACKEHFNCLMDNAFCALWYGRIFTKLYESSLDS